MSWRVYLLNDGEVYWSVDFSSLAVAWRSVRTCANIATSFRFSAVIMRRGGAR